MSQSTLAAVMLFASSISPPASTRPRTANLNTAPPSICKYRLLWDGVHSTLGSLPSACIRTERTPGFLAETSTTAAAPSPKRTQVDLSFQSRSRDIVSAPTTSAVFNRPDAIMPSAKAKPYMNPEQAADKSNAPTFLAPRRACNRAAVDGNTRSGVIVATMIRSMSRALTPAFPSARALAIAAISAVLSPSPAMRRCTMPVIVRIHASLVSSVEASSSFVTIRDGR